MFDVSSEKQWRDPGKRRWTRSSESALSFPLTWSVFLIVSHGERLRLSRAPSKRRASLRTCYDCRELGSASLMLVTGAEKYNNGHECVAPTSAVQVLTELHPETIIFLVPAPPMRIRDTWRHTCTCVHVLMSCVRELCTRAVYASCVHEMCTRLHQSNCIV